MEKEVKRSGTESKAMNGHSQDCDGHCGWNRTFCDEQWMAFLQHMSCIDGPRGCQGVVADRASLSGSGMAFPRCETHYAAYAERMGQRLAAIRSRYPSSAPADFDPLAAGERWDEDDPWP